MNRKKRKQDDCEAGPEASKKAKADKQNKDLKTQVPVDEGFSSEAAARAQVHVNENDEVLDVFLNQTNIGNNANKFYRLQLLHVSGQQFHVHTRWGRVGEFGQVKTMGPMSLEQAWKTFRSKFREKAGHPWDDKHATPKSGKYTFIEKSYEPDEVDDDDGVKEIAHNGDEVPEKLEEVPSKLPVETQKLVKLIFDEIHFHSVLEKIGYNEDKLPLGKLGQGTLKKGFESLKELSNLIKNPDLAVNYQTSHNQAILDLTNRYYSTIPHVFGRNRPPPIDSWNALQREVYMLDTLCDMEVASEIMRDTEAAVREASGMNLLDQRFQRLGMDEMTPLKQNTEEFKLLELYLINTSGTTHNINYKIQNIFRISRRGEDSRFQDSKFSSLKNSCRFLLWHGSPITNFGGILSQGLRVAPPEAPVNGYAFGKGIYLADISTKSANYCLSHMSDGDGLLLLCEAEVGNPMYEIVDSDPYADEAARNANCVATCGVGQTVPLGWMDAGALHGSLKGCLMPDPSKKIGQQTNHKNASLQYNEYICYDVAQRILKARKACAECLHQFPNTWCKPLKWCEFGGRATTDSTFAYRILLNTNLQGLREPKYLVTLKRARYRNARPMQGYDGV